ncbi:MAG: tetratricopeptide repeat protein, partial [Bacteroidales bacterium]
MLHDKFITFLLSFLLSSGTVALSQTKKPVEEEINTLFNQEQTEKAKHKIDSIKKLPYFKNNDTLQAELYRLTSQYYRHKNKIDSAIKYREKAWAILQNDNFDKHFIDYLPTLAYYHWEAGSYSNALELIQEAKRNINKTDSVHHSRVYNILGLTYLELRNFEKAEENFFNAIELAKKYSNERYLGVIYANTGRLYYRKGECKKAIKYYGKGSSLEMKSDDYKAAGRSYADIGNIYINLENYEKARTKLDTALKFNKRSKDQLGYCRTYLALGRLSQKQEQYNDAEEYFLKVIKYAKEKT